MKISEIKAILKAELLTGEDHLDDIVVGCGAADLMDDVLAAAAEGALLLTGLTSENVLRTAKVAGVSAIAFVRGKHPAPKIVKMAQTFHLPLLLTEFSLFIACGRLYLNGLRGLDGSW